MMAPEPAGAAFFPYQSFSRDTFPISPATIAIVPPFHSVGIVNAIACVAGIEMRGV
jgi:hypothetical protein